MIPLVYETTGVHPLASTARALGLLLTVFGTIHLFILDPLSLFVTMRQQAQFSPAQRGTILAIFIPSLLISLVLSSMEMGVGIAALRRQPGAVRWLHAWAWCALVYGVLGASVNIWYQFSASTMVYSSLRAYGVFYVLERWLRSLTIPVVALMLLRSRSFRNAFTSEY